MGRTSNLKFKGGLMQEAETDIINTYLLSWLRSECGVLSATALKSCQGGVRCCQQRTSEGRERMKDEMKRSEGNAKETYL